MKFLAEATAMTITFEGLEIFWALKRRLVIPKEQIADLSWQSQYRLQRRMLRLVGTDVPGLLWAGRFIGGDKRAFLYVQRPYGVTWSRNPQPMQDVLVLTLRDNHFDEVIISCQPDIGAELVAWWQAAVPA